MPFFQQFPKTSYDFGSNGIDTTIVDLFRFVKANDKFFDDILTYQYFEVRNGDRPDIVSNLIYGTPDYYWTFFIINEHLKSGISGWPMNQDEMDEYFVSEYPGQVIETRPIIVRDGDGLITEHRNSLANRFTIGETITGLLSGARGKVMSKDANLSQLVITPIRQSRITLNTADFSNYYTQGESISMTLPDGKIRSAEIVHVDIDGSLVVEYITGTFTVGKNLVGAISGCSRAFASLVELDLVFQDDELIVGNLSASQVTIYKVWDRPDAPHHYELADGSIYYNPVHISEQNTEAGNDPTITTGGLTAVSNRAYEIDVNDQRGNIRVVRPQSIYKFVQMYQALINDNG